MKLTLPLFTIILLILSCFFSVQANAQVADTSKHVFQLGQVNIIGTKDSLRSNKLSAGTLNLYNRYDVSHALSLLPGVTLTAIGPRNESAVNVRGFDIRQVPVYLDGIPLYVPYDGYVDLARYNTFNLSEINISKGYSSVLFGPNAEGGAINLVSRKPANPFELNAVAGYLNGGYRLNTNIGSNLGKFYYQVSASQLKRDYFPLSSSFTPVKNEDGGHRDNSYSNDIDVSGKVGFTPTASQEYAIGYSYHHGTKGTPVYAGNDPQNSLLTKPRYWKWPNWDTQGLYLLSNNKINATNVIKTRWYYSQFKNEIDSYDDVNYSTITKPYAFKSIYNDYTLGGSVIFENTDIKNNSFSVVGQYKQDVHREHNVGEPTRRDADNNFYAGAEDTYHITSALKVNAGVGFNDRRNTQAQLYSNNVISDLPGGGNSAWNVQGLVQYDLDDTNSLSFSVARKTRFATIKDRYSFKLGTAIPNPDLKAEDALNYDLSYHTLIGSKLTLQASGFYSKINNSIQTVNNVAVDPTTHVNLSQVQNVGRAEYYGAEFAAGYPINTQLRVDANYTLIVRNNLSAPQIYFTDVPKHKVFASIQYSPVAKLYVLASEEYNSKRYSTSYGTTSGAFYLSNVKAHLTLVKGLSLEGGVNNLFDRNYTLVEGYPEEGRNYFVNLMFNY
ncbi:TonB-dependent receptor plug domain-containing protein [Mucilaginibacter dorajii]|uniref:TonB-dependent receptor plug domain-containing protein n=1 Tax=Mucilaginibacter dorajii TaxID=692994 RepID=UPI002166F206|nr:TonB-dependent receptor plug domain-containing protein [Mucilaginibacter dorajii]MCS3732103.1 iron complex outermembrane receptor protein [Mucilaginibacter dorajii]